MISKNMSMSTDPDEVCGTVYAAKLLGLSVGSVQALVERSELQAWKTKGGHRRISLQSIRDYQAKHGLSFQGSREGGLRVLVVDDDKASLAALTRTIESWGLPIRCTGLSSAIEAVVDIGSIRPDVLLTDLRMPGVNGFELLRTLTNNPAFSSLVVVAMSGLSKREVEREGGLPERAILIQKPIDLKWLNGFFTALVAARRHRGA